jgi:hypothetical protein
MWERRFDALQSGGCSRFCGCLRGRAMQHLVNTP